MVVFPTDGRPHGGHIGSGLAVIDFPRYADETEACGHAESVSDHVTFVRYFLPVRFAANHTD